MPNYEPPFTIYWTTFYTTLTTQPIEAQHQDDNIEAIYNIIKNSSLTITDYAIYGIIAASWAVAGLNPARIRHDYLIIDPDVPTTATGYGLWMDIRQDPDSAGYRETTDLINNILHGGHYSHYNDPSQIPPIDTPTLAEYLESDDDNLLGWYWVLNYVHYRYAITEDLLTAEYKQFCADTYDAIKQYITTNPRRLNPVFIAFLKKRKKRWWRND